MRCGLGAIPCKMYGPCQSEGCETSQRQPCPTESQRLVVGIDFWAASIRDSEGMTELVSALVRYIVQQLRCDDGIAELFEKAVVFGPAESSVQGTLWRLVNGDGT